MSPPPDECQFWLREGEQRGFHRGLEYVRQAVASEPTLSWPGEIDDILELNRGCAVVTALLAAEKVEIEKPWREALAHAIHCVHVTAVGRLCPDCESARSLLATDKASEGGKL